jgi:hypothetical protein
MDPTLLPRNTEELARQECLEAGEPWEGLREFAVFCLECTELDRAGYMMGDTIAIFLKDLYRELSLDAAVVTSKEWIGTETVEADLDHIPGMFRGAFLSDISGHEERMNGAEFLWKLPGDGVEKVVRYPFGGA